MLIIGGTYKYVLTLIRLNETDKKLSNILSEMDTLHKSYKNEIAQIKKIQNAETPRAFEQAVDAYDRKMIKFLDQNKPRVKQIKIKPWQYG